MKVGSEPAERGEVIGHSIVVNKGDQLSRRFITQASA